MVQSHLGPLSAVVRAFQLPPRMRPTRLGVSYPHACRSSCRHRNRRSVGSLEPIRNTRLGCGKINTTLDSRSPSYGSPKPNGCLVPLQVSLTFGIGEQVVVEDLHPVHRLCGYPSCSEAAIGMCCRYRRRLSMYLSTIMVASRPDPAMPLLMTHIRDAAPRSIVRIDCS